MSGNFSQQSGPYSMGQGPSKGGYGMPPMPPHGHGPPPGPTSVLEYPPASTVGRGRYKHLYGGNGIFSHGTTTQYPPQDSYGQNPYDYGRGGRPGRGGHGAPRYGQMPGMGGMPYGQMQGGYPMQQQGFGGPIRGMSKFKSKLCSFFMDSKGLFCPHGPGCQFAHGYDDIRIPGEGGAASQPAPPHLVALLKQAAAKRAAMGTPVSVLEDPLATLNSVDGQAGAEWAATLSRGGMGVGVGAGHGGSPYGSHGGAGAAPMMSYDGGMQGRHDQSYSVPAGYFGPPVDGGSGGGYGGQYSSPPPPPASSYPQQQQGGYGGYGYAPRPTTTSGPSHPHDGSGKGGTTTGLQLGPDSASPVGGGSTGQANGHGGGMPEGSYLGHPWAGPGGMSDGSGGEASGLGASASSSASAPGADLYSMVDNLTASVNGLHLGAHDQGAGSQQGQGR